MKKNKCGNEEEIKNDDKENGYSNKEARMIIEKIKYKNIEKRAKRTENRIYM